MSRVKKSFYNILAQGCYEIVSMVCALILPKLIISTYGSTYNGLVSSITQFLEYISFLTLGIAGATRVALYKTIAKDDIRATSAVLKAHQLYMRKVGLCLLGYTAVLTIVFPLMNKGVFAWSDIASLVLIISIGTMVEYFFGITSRTFLMANQSQYIATAIDIIIRIVYTALSVFIINKGASIQLTKLVGMIILAAGPITMNYLVRKKYGILNNVEPDNSALAQRMDVAASSIANTIHQYVDIFMLTLFTDFQTVSVYTVYTLVTSSLKKLQNVFTTGLEGAFGELWARGEKKQFENRLSLFEFLIFSFCTVIFACAGILILPFVSIYTKGVTDTNYYIPSFAVLSILATAFFCLRAPYLTAVQAAGKYKETRNGAIAEAVINFSLSLFGVFKFGIVGVTIGTVAANLFRSVQYSIFTSSKLLQRSYWIVIKRFLWTCFTVALILVVYYWEPIRFEIVSWLTWLEAATFWFVVASSITLVSALVFCRKDLLNAFSLMKAMVRRK